MTPVISCVDLDSTFVYTTRDAEKPLHRVLTTNPSTGSRTYMTAQQETLWELIHQMGEVVPVTGRTWESVERLGLRFQGYKICCHGGLILDSGNQPVEAWQRLSSGPVQNRQLAQILEFWQGCIHRERLEARVWIVEGAGEGMYVSAKGEPPVLKLLQNLLIESRLLPGDYKVHHNHRNMAILPFWVRKEKALVWLRKHYLTKEALWLGFGDSLTDLPFMQACDFWLTPAGSQIDEGARIWNVEDE